jgi:hypothetical protein
MLHKLDLCELPLKQSTAGREIRRAVFTTKASGSVEVDQEVVYGLANLAANRDIRTACPIAGGGHERIAPDQ